MDKINLTYNGLIEKLMTAINTLDGPTLANNLIKNHEKDYLSTTLIPAEAE